MTLTELALREGVKLGMEGAVHSAFSRRLRHGRSAAGVTVHHHRTPAQARACKVIAWIVGTVFALLAIAVAAKGMRC